MFLLLTDLTDRAGGATTLMAPRSPAHAGQSNGRGDWI
jgi:hypothetical protein